MGFSSDVDYLVQQINEKEPVTIKHKKKIEKVIQSKAYIYQYNQ